MTRAPSPAQRGRVGEGVLRLANTPSQPFPAARGRACCVGCRLSCHMDQRPLRLVDRIIHGGVMSDQLPTATRVSEPGIRALYRLENRWQAWLDVEVALARSQAELGIIPHDAAEAIARAARLELLDRARIDEGFARTGHTIVPLVWELSRVVGEPHGGWV